MRFKNNTDKILRTQFGSEPPIVVAPGVEVEIDARWVPFIELRGTALDPVKPAAKVEEKPAPEASVEEKPAAKPAKK